MLRKIFVFSALLFILTASVAAAQEGLAYMVTFGKECPTNWGDDNFNQVVYVAVPKDAAPFYLWIFDPDCAGAIDEINKTWNTSTKFAFYGGPQAFTHPEAKGANPGAALTSGKLLKEQTFSNETATDDNWVAWGPFETSQGETVGDLTFFKISITGESGDDGNLYDFLVSSSGTTRAKLEGSRYFAYAVGFRLPQTIARVVRMNLIPDAAVNQITVHNFDGDNQAGISLNSPSGNVIPVQVSANDSWSQTSAPLSGDQAGLWSVDLAKPAKGNNDIVFHIEGASVDLPLTTAPIKPKMEKVAATRSGCNKVMFDASKTTDPNSGDKLTYEWDFGDGQKGTGITIEHTYAKPGSYPITLTVRDNSGTICAVSNDMANVVVNDPPVADAGVDIKNCPNVDLTFDGSRSFDRDGKITEYNWNFGDGTTGTGPKPTHKYAKPGTYQVKLTVKDDSGTECNTASDEMTVVLNAPPVADAGPDQSILGTTTILYDGCKSNDPDADKTMPGDPLVYTWDFGDGTPPVVSGCKPVHTYAKPGKYTVKLTVKDRSGTDCDTDTDEMIVIINFAPVANAGDDKLGCANEAFTFDASKSTDTDGKVAKFTWDFGDGETGAGASVSHKYAKPGIYSVTLVIEDDAATTNSKAVDGLTVTVNAAPVAVAGKDEIGCVNEDIQFDGTKSYDPDGQIASYKWDFGDGTTAATAKPTHKFAKPGKFTVKLTVTDNSGTTCGTASDELIVTINQPPVANAGKDVLTCEPGLTFNGEASTDADGKVVQYMWDFGDGGKGSGQIVSHVYAKPGTYKVTLTVKDDSGTKCDTDTDDMQVVINAVPVAKAAVSAKERVWVCADDKLDFDGSASMDPDGSITAHEWDFGDGTPAAKGAKVTHAYAKPGNYIARLTVTDNSGTKCDKGYDEVFIKINARPVAEAGPNTNGCISEAIQFNGNMSNDPDGKITKYAWDFGDGGKSDQMSPTHPYAKPGKYTVKLTVTDDSPTACNTHSDEMTVVINDPPVAEAGPDVTTCNTTLNFDGSGSKDPDGGSLDYAWDFGDGGKAEGIRPTHTYAKAGTYKVVLIVRDETGTKCSSDSDSLRVFINLPPTAKAGDDQKVCLGEAVSFDGSTSADPEKGALTYGWDFGDPSTSSGPAATGAKATHDYKKAGIYKVVLTATDDSKTSCNFDKDEMTVTVYEKPTANAGEDTKGCVNDVITFDGSKSGDPDGLLSAYAWDFGDGATGEGMVATHIYTKAGRYEAKLTVTDNSGMKCNTAVDTRVVTINQPPAANAGEKRMVCADEAVAFDGLKSSDADGKITAYTWDFGGVTAKEVKATHSYKKPGVYEASLTVKDDSGLSCDMGSSAVTIVVNDPPSANAGSDQFSCVLQDVMFDGTASFDRDGKITAYAWDFGDGTKGEGAKPTHKYAKAGAYDVTLTVTDDSGTKCNTHVDKMRVVIKEPPVAEAGPEQMIACNGCATDEVLFDASGSKDPDGDGLTFAWDFGDGSKADGIRVTHAYKAPGQYTVTLTVTDDSGLKCNQDTDTIKVHVNKAPDPVIQMGSK